MNQDFLIRIRVFMRSILSLNTYVDIQATNENIRKNIAFKGPNVYILFFAVVIASVGLNVNSIPVIIGAMLISPLMGPIIGFGHGLGTGDSELLLSSFKNLCVMIGISLLASILYFLVTPLEIDNPTELLARTRPTIYDVMIALFGGLAGTLETARKEKGTVLSGVAIATALMPPLCTVGYGIANLSWKYTIGASFLFIINCIFIALAAYIMAKFLKFPNVNNQPNHAKYKYITYIIIAGMIVTSIYTGYNVIKENNFLKVANKFVRKNQSIGKTYIYDYNVNTVNTPYTLELRLAGESLSAQTREMFYRDAESVGIMRNQLHIVEDATIQFEKFNETEIVKNLIQSNEEQLKQRDDSIRVLNNSLEQYIKLQLPVKQLAAELMTQLPSVKDVVFTRGERMTRQSDLSEQIVVIVYSDEKINHEEIDRLTQWLKVRLNMENVMLINM
ncbi:MAG: DUF389 domain-containing protein [Paludibacteraceae bacterium]|nr:DUF389 domain-containing protein [Paludibacteraceae bacterium]